jgi:uncharacterized protein YceK
MSQPSLRAKNGKSLEIRSEPGQHLFTRRVALRRPPREIPKMKKIFALLLLPVLLAGCSSITNLTPSRYSRDPSGFYRVEAQWRSNRQAIREDSFKPLVVVDNDTYPMRPVGVVKDRWEAFIPVPADKDMIHYHYKFDFLINAISQPRADSLMSSDYELKIAEGK